MSEKKNNCFSTSIISRAFKNIFSVTTSSLLIFVIPASTNYQLRDFGVGSGGVGNAASANYSASVISGEVDNGKLSGTSYSLGSGLYFTNQAHVPLAPTFTNPNNSYNSLKIILDASSNPSDAVFAIAISNDGFTTSQYVQNDATAGNVLGIEDYQTYAAWGGATGTTIVGLLPSTTYTVKVKVMQGKFTETSYGPIATAATVGSELSFDIDVAATDTETASPYVLAMGDLTPNTIVDSTEKIWVDFASNAVLGGNVYISSVNSGLKSTANSHTIASTTGNLTSATEAMGVQGSTAVNGLTLPSPYNGTLQNVGIVNTTPQQIFNATAPTTNGRGSFSVKAKSSAITPAATDYTETFQLTVSASF